MKADPHITASDLLLSIKNGDVDAYVLLYDLYKDPLMRYALQRLGDADAAEDIVQDLFMYIWSNREQLPEIQNINGYLLQATRNRVLHNLQKKKSETAYLDAQQFFNQLHTAPIEPNLFEKELHDFIQQEIARLPDKMREVFKLSREEGLSHKQIAAITGTSEQTIAKQISNALRILRSKIKLFYLFFPFIINMLK